MPVGMLRDQGAHRRQIIARERAALEADRFHWPQESTSSGAVSPAENVQTPELLFFIVCIWQSNMHYDP
jgi:hypothetical protein